MPSNVLLLGFLVLLTVTAAVSLPVGMSWVDYSYVFAGFNLCNNATGVCRTLSHWVYVIKPPASPLAMVSSGADFKLDDGEWQAGQPGNFEAHIVNGQCSDTSNASSCVYYDGGKTQGQVWNWGYDAVYANADVSQLPSQICIKAFAQDILTKETGSLPSACNPAPVTFVNVPRTLDWDFSFMYALSAEVAHFLCDKDYCRLNAHNSIDISVPDPTDVMTSTTYYKIDGGEWRTDSSITFFEQKVKQVNGTFYHTFSWNLDVINRNKGQKGPEEICFKSWITNRITTATAWVDLGEYATEGKYVRCMKICRSVTAFSHTTNAGGYCPGDEVRQITQ